MRPITLLLPICLFCCVPASALSYAGFENEHKSFHNITFHTDGNKVRDVFQDSSGLVWIATSNGLPSYDGTYLLTVNLRNCTWQMDKQ